MRHKRCPRGSHDVRINIWLPPQEHVNIQSKVIALIGKKNTHLWGVWLVWINDEIHPWGHRSLHMTLLTWDNLLGNYLWPVPLFQPVLDAGWFPTIGHRLDQIIWNPPWDLTRQIRMRKEIQHLNLPCQRAVGIDSKGGGGYQWDNGFGGGGGFGRGPEVSTRWQQKGIGFHPRSHNIATDHIPASFQLM